MIRQLGSVSCEARATNLVTAVRIVISRLCLNKVFGLRVGVCPIDEVCRTRYTFLVSGALAE
jgi:hypothetical protein